MTESVAVIGDGAMGTICAVILARKGYEVALWGYDASQIAQCQEFRENRRFLPGLQLPLSLELTADDTQVFKNVHLAVSCPVPTGC